MKNSSRLTGSSAAWILVVYKLIVVFVCCEFLSMLYGTIVQFFPQKGFGFIKPDVGPDVFFHVTALGACQTLPELRIGQPVKYELVPGTEPKPIRRGRNSLDGPATSPTTEPAKPAAQLVELIDRIPGGTLRDPEKKHPESHPRARHRKPTWRR